MADPQEDYRVVLTTAGTDDQARAIARELVRRRLAACVNIVPRVSSVFRWQGEIHEDDESLLVIKTSRSLFPRVREAIRELHSYEVPEVLALAVEDGSPDYLRWLGDCLGEEG